MTAIESSVRCKSQIKRIRAQMSEVSFLSVHCADEYSRITVVYEILEKERNGKVGGPVDNDLLIEAIERVRRGDD